MPKEKQTAVKPNKPCKEPGCNAFATFHKGYCSIHSLGHFPDDPKVIEGEKKRKQSLKGSHKTRKDRTKLEIEAEKENQRINKKETEKRKATDLYHKIAQDKDFDLNQEMKDCLELEPNDMESEVKELFISWLMADVATRKPEGLKDVAGILGVKPILLRRWQEDKEFNDRLTRTKITRNTRFSVHLDKTVAVLAMLGEKHGLEKFYNDVSQTLPEEKKDRYELTPELAAMMKKASGAEGNKTGKTHMTDIEKDFSKTAAGQVPYGNVEIKPNPDGVGDGEQNSNKED